MTTGFPGSFPARVKCWWKAAPRRSSGASAWTRCRLILTDIPDASIGAEVLLYGTHNGHTLRPEQVSQMAGTISYELLTRLGERVHRIYIEP